VRQKIRGPRDRVPRAVRYSLRAACLHRHRASAAARRCRSTSSPSSRAPPPTTSA